MGRRCWTPRLLLLLVVVVLGQILLIVDQAGSSSPANKTIRIGFLMQREVRAGAMTVAIERAQNDGLLRDYRFRLTRKYK